MADQEAKVRELLDRMRNWRGRFREAPGGSEVVLANTVNEWADELEALLVSPGSLKCFMCGNAPPPPMVSNDIETVAICGECAAKVAKFLASPGSVSDQGWRDISTAPENEIVLLWEPTLPQVVTAEKRGGKWPWFYKPTHWMPLPKSPTTSPVSPASDQGKE